MGDVQNSAVLSTWNPLNASICICPFCKLKSSIASKPAFGELVRHLVNQPEHKAFSSTLQNTKLANKQSKEKTKLGN